VNEKEFDKPIFARPFGGMGITSTFRSRLKAEIASQNRSIRWLSWRSGYSEEYIRRILTGAKSNPSLLFVECLADSLEVDPLDLLR
jgi:hypothetical protein